MKTLVIITMLFVATPCLAFESTWDKYDTALAVTSVSLIVVDWAQTRTLTQEKNTNCKNDVCVYKDGSYNPNRKYEETHPLLGKHPSKTKVDIWGLTYAIFTPVIAYYVPDLIFDNPKYASFTRKAFLSGIIYVEADAVVNNYQIGVRIKF